MQNLIHYIINVTLNLHALRLPSRVDVDLYYCITLAIGRGTVRLYSNNSTSSSLTAGIVQIYYGNSAGTNTWGNICEDDSFGHNEADVICNQLGYNGASTYGKAGSTTR